MSLIDARAGRLAAAATGVLLTLSSPVLLATSANAADRDHDGMRNRWEVRHGLDPRSDDAARDHDHDGLRNIAEYRRHLDPSDEDSDADGDDDGDEVGDGEASTDPHDEDTDGDDRPDGDEDADHDGTDNEDEDDATESCRGDDDDSDHDGLDDEDENELGGDVDDADTDGDEIEDGDEDGDDDGEADEDEDDDADDHCGRGHGEDADDLLGTIVSYDAFTGELVIDAATSEVDLTFLVTDDTEIEWDHSGRSGDDDGDDDGDGDGDGDGVSARNGSTSSDDDEASTADLQPGTQVAEVDVDDDSGELEEIELIPAP